MEGDRIAFVLPSLGKGGAQRATISLANYLASMKNSHITLIALKDDQLEFELHKDIEVLKLASPSFKASIKKLIVIFRKCRPDIVYSALWHVNLLVLLSKFVLMFIYGTRFKHIASVHNNPTRIIQTENKYLAIAYYYGLARFSYKVVAVSKGIQNHLVQRCYIPKSKVVMAYNPAITATHVQQLTQKIGISFVERHSGAYLLWVGRLDFQKDPIKFLQTVKLSGLPAVIVGDGPLEFEVLDFISKYDMAELVLYLPFQENVMYLMANSYLLLMTSRFEGFGLVLVESLFAGTPVISTNCLYGPAEIIENKKNGLLLGEVASADDFYQAIQLLQGSPELYAEMRKYAPSSVECFTDKVVFEQYRELFS